MQLVSTGMQKKNTLIFWNKGKEYDFNQAEQDK